jgi:two-component system sensor histidine kinase MtrB
MNTFDWRSHLARLARFWRVSLQFRTVAITVLLSGFAVLVTGGFISVSIGNNLFASRSMQVQEEARSAHNLAQGIFDAAEPTDNQAPTVELDSLSGTVQDKILPSTTAPGSTKFAILRTPGQGETPQNMQPSSSTNFPAKLVTEALRAAVIKDVAHVQYVSATLPNGSPALVVGSQVTVPTAGSYELYLVYDLSSVQRRSTTCSRRSPSVVSRSCC